MKYEKLIVIGSGKIACECIKVLKSYNDKIICIENEESLLSFVKSICNINNLEYKLIESKKKLLQYFLKISEKTLIISANNNYIFPKEVVNKDNLKIINFHNALLPYHPGRNAPT